MMAQGRMRRVGFAAMALLVFAMAMALRQTLAGTFARALLAALAFAFGAAGVTMLIRLRP